MFLTTEFNAGTAAMGAGAAVLIMAFVVIIYALDFLFTMFVYNNVAPKGSNALRLICTALICFAINIVITYIMTIVNKTQGPVFTTSSVVGWLVDAFIGVAIAKFCTDKFRGTLWTKSLKGAVLYIVITIVVTLIFALIFGGAMVGGYLPAAMQSGTAA